MAQDPTARWLTTKEAASLLRVHPKHVYRLLKRGLPASRFGGQWRFQASEIVSWGRSTGRASGNHDPHLATTLVPTLVAAADDLAVAELLGLLQRQHGPWVGRVELTAGGLDAVVRGSVLGCALLGEVAELPEVPLARILLGHVQLGLAARPGEPTASLAALAKGRCRLAAWPEGSELRGLLDGVLRREGIDPAKAHRRAVPVRSHAEALGAVIAQRADCAWTSLAWAQRFGMPLLPLASRSLGLVVQACSLAHPAVIRCWQVVQSQAFRDAVGCLPGHDLKGAGEIRYLPHRDSPGFDSALAPATRPQRAPRARPRCAILCRGHGQDGSALLRRILRALQDRGVRVCGCLQVRRESQGKLVGYDLARIGRAGSLVLARRDLPARDGFSPFRFRDETFRAARAWLAEDGADARIAVIDSWGALEAKGQGHFEALAAALHPSAPGLVLGSARRDLVPAILHRLAVSDDAALRIDLPCAPRDERRFIDALARAVGAG